MYSWQYSLITILIIWHSMSSVYSIYLHRGKGHKLFVFHPALEHFFRFWLWFTIGFSWPNWMQYWVAKHRKHHRYSDTIDDPHSPFYMTFKEMRDMTCDANIKANYISPEELQEYASDIISHNDWIERNLYCKYNKLGMKSIVVIQTILFGWVGFIIGASFYLGTNYIGIFTGNYITHRFGFNYAGNRGADRSKIVFPISFLLGGEELHTHHHNDTSKPYFSRHWWEFDIGWCYAKILIFFGLIKLTNPTNT